MGMIVNEKGYQQEIKLARINNNFYEVRDRNVYLCEGSAGSSSAISGNDRRLYTQHHNSNPSCQKIFDAFQNDETPKNKRITTSK